MNHDSGSASLAEKLVDSPTDVFSLRGLISKIFLRPKLFLFALLIPPIIATLMALMVPPDWTASTKILIRYNTNDQGVLKSLVGDTGLDLSGATSAELMRSKPVLEKAIDDVGIVKSDIYKKPTKVIAAKLASFFSSKDDDESEEDSKTELINSFKGSLDSSAKKSSANSIAVLEKTSTTPETFKLDELITLQVKSFNREKVDDMANGLAAAFIQEHYRLNLEEAKKKSRYISELIKKEEALLRRIEAATPENIDSFIIDEKTGGGLLSRDVAILSNMTSALTDAMTELSRAKQIYSDSSPQVIRLVSQVNNLQFTLKKQERIEVVKQLLERLKSKRFQVGNAEKIFESDLVPISIAEYADEPKKSGSKKLIKVIISAVVGIVLGTISAISLMIILNVIDPRVHLRSDIEDMLPNKIIAQIPMIKKASFNHYQALQDNPDMTQGVWQLFSKIGRKADTKDSKLISISSTSQGEGASTIAGALALDIAKNKDNKVCIIDADFENADLSKLFNLDNKAGIIDSLIDNNKDMLSRLDSSNLIVLSAGNLSRKNELGYYAQQMESLIDSMKKHFDYIVVDTGPVLKGNEAGIFSSLADEVLMVSASGVTRKGALKVAISKLQESTKQPINIVFNKTKKVLPDFIYNTI